MKEKEREMIAAAQLKKELEEKQEEEERKKFREMTNFKATPIRKYKPIDTSHIVEKPLTIP